MGGSKGGVGGVWTPPPGKSQVAIGSLRNTGTDPSREAIGPKGANCFSREVRTAPRLAKCRQISIFAMPVAFTGKYWQIMENTGKCDLQPSTFRLVISIIEVI